MQSRFERLALFGIGEELGGEALALGGVGNDLVDDVIGVDRLDAEFVQVARDERLAARDPACQGDPLHLRWMTSTL